MAAADALLDALLDAHYRRTPRHHAAGVVPSQLGQDCRTVSSRPPRAAPPRRSPPDRWPTWRACLNTRVLTIDLDFSLAASWGRPEALLTCHEAFRASFLPLPTQSWENLCALARELCPADIARLVAVPRAAPGEFLYGLDMRLGALPQRAAAAAVGPVDGRRHHPPRLRHRQRCRDRRAPADLRAARPPGAADVRPAQGSGQPPQAAPRQAGLPARGRPAVPADHLLRAGQRAGPHVLLPGADRELRGRLPRDVGGDPRDEPERNRAQRRALLRRGRGGRAGAAVRRARRPPRGSGRGRTTRTAPVPRPRPRPPG